MDEMAGIKFKVPTNNSQIIKVVGVGGGGGNAVNYMYRQGIKDVYFVVCNTDEQALKESPIMNKVLLGAQITQGLGAGNKPGRAREAALESLADIESVLMDNTKMAFITAGMGGGTGTGAAPIVAKVAKDLGILTVGIVTIPFEWEGKSKIQQAYKGVREMSKHVDAILVINNEKLRTVYPDLAFSNAFAKVNDVLTQAAKGIAEIVTIPGHINLDFADVNTTMKDGGVAIMNTGIASGEHRISKAIEDALNSPLVHDSNIHEAKKILMNIYCSKTDQVLMDETIEIHEFMDKMGDDIEVIWGITFEDDLGDNVKITIIATGFGIDILPNEVKEENDFAQHTKEKPEDTSANLWMEKNYPDKAEKIRQSVSSSVLDDEDYVLQMEQIPAYKRKKQ